MTTQGNADNVLAGSIPAPALSESLTPVKHEKFYYPVFAAFNLPLDPKSMQHGNRMGRDARGRVIVVPTREKEAYVRAIGLLSKRYRPKTPIGGPLALDVSLIFKRVQRKDPNTFPAPNGRTWHAKRPDADNVLKGLQDALTKAGFWWD